MPPWQSPYPIIADASRLYFSDFGLGQLGILQVSKVGGEAERFPISAPSPDAQFQPLSLSPDGSALIMNHLDFSLGLPFELWSYPLVGGTPRVLGRASDAAYSPDGALVAYEGEFGKLFVANADFSEPRELLQEPRRVHWIRFSPDGKRLRFTMLEVTQQQTIWEVAVDGGEARPILPGWADVDHCCGVWTPDGKYFVFQAEHDFRTQFWAMSGDSDSAVEPVQITKSALEFRRPSISVDGKTIYAVSWQLRGEVVRYDTQVDTFVPLPGFESVSGEWFSYSGDGELVAYTSYPQADLWRSNSDGSDRRQLTFPPMRVLYGVWSPDNRFIVFIGQMPNEPRQVYLVSADGGLPQPLTNDEHLALAPSWFPDSRRILLYMDTKERLQVYDIEDGTFTPMPGTEGLRGPELSPDGTRFMAFSAEGVVVQEVESGERDVLIRTGESSAEITYWDKDGEHIFVVESFMKGIERSVRRMNIEDKSSETVAIIGNTRSAWGVYGMWVGVDPGAAPIMLKDISIHHIYKLDWLQ